MLRSRRAPGFTALHQNESVLVRPLYYEAKRAHTAGFYIYYHISIYSNSTYKENTHTHTKASPLNSSVSILCILLQG